MILVVAATRPELCGAGGLVCGVGPVEAAASTSRELATGSFDAILHVGLAGARGISNGSLVVGTEAVYGDLSAEFPVVRHVTADPRLVDAVRRALPEAAALPIHTSAAVGGSRSRRSGGLLVEAMEGFAVLRACELAGVPAVEVRAISNELGEADRSRWEIERALAALESAIPLLRAALAG